MMVHSCYVCTVFVKLSRLKLFISVSIAAKYSSVASRFSRRFKILETDVEHPFFDMAVCVDRATRPLITAPTGPNS